MVLFNNNGVQREVIKPEVIKPAAEVVQDITNSGLNTNSNNLEISPNRTIRSDSTAYTNRSIINNDNNTNDNNNNNDNENNDSEDYDEFQDLKQQYKLFYAEDPELCSFLRKLSIGEVMIVKLIEHFHIKNVRKELLLKDSNPYKLMEIDGFGFTKTDNIAKLLNIKDDDPRRQRALIQFVLETNRSFGNVYLHTTILEKECKKQGVRSFDERLKEMIDKDEVILDENRIYLKKLYIAECEVCDYVRKLVGKEVIVHKHVLTKMAVDSKACKVYDDLNIPLDDDDIPF